MLFPSAPSLLLFFRSPRWLNNAACNTGRAAVTAHACTHGAEKGWAGRTQLRRRGCKRRLDASSPSAARNRLARRLARSSRRSPLDGVRRGAHCCPLAALTHCAASVPYCPPVGSWPALPLGAWSPWPALLGPVFRGGGRGSGETVSGRARSKSGAGCSRSTSARALLGRLGAQALRLLHQLRGRLGGLRVVRGRQQRGKAGRAAGTRGQQRRGRPTDRPQLHPTARPPSPSRLGLAHRLRRLGAVRLSLLLGLQRVRSDECRRQPAAASGGADGECSAAAQRGPGVQARPPRSLLPLGMPLGARVWPAALPAAGRPLAAAALGGSPWLC